MSTHIGTLVEDINKVIEGKGGWDQTVSSFFRENVSDVVDSRLSSAEETEQRSGLRLSNMGTPCIRKLWYECNPDGYDSSQDEELPPSARLKFLYGDILESLLIALAKAAGHRVEGMQDTLYVNGIKGHRDCVIDGVTVDVKSASTYSFRKFAEKGLRDNDSFGYISQLSSYVYAGRTQTDVDVHPTLGAFLVVDKTLGHLCLDIHDFTREIETIEERFDEIKEATSSDMIPDRLEEVDVGKSGNKGLGLQCSYCPKKVACWPTLRKFKSSRGPVFLTSVKREPRMEEVK